MYQPLRSVTLLGMRRFAGILALSLLAVGGCGSAATPAPSYADPGAMASKAGAVDCGGVDEAATYAGAHYVVCKTSDGGMVQFVAGESEAAAENAERAMQAIGWVVERRGSWAVGADDEAQAKAIAASLGG